MKKLKRLGLFCTSDAEKYGIDRKQLSRMVRAEKLIRVERGIYLHPQSPIKPEELDYALVKIKFGEEAVVGGLSALFHYNLSTQVPNKIWVLVPYNKKTALARYRCIHTQTPLEIGVIVHRHYKIVSVERAIVEALRFSTKIGLALAINAARKSIKENMTTEQKILSLSKKLKLERFVMKHWDSIVSQYE